jgi:major histocompatibility complex class I
MKKIHKVRKMLTKTAVRLHDTPIKKARPKTNKDKFNSQQLHCQLKTMSRRAVVAHTFNPSTWEAEAGGFLSLRPAWSTK